MPWCNILVNPMPSTVDVDGIRVPIDTDWRTWVQATLAAGDPDVPDGLRAGIVLSLAYGERVPDDREAALAAAMGFLSRDGGHVPRAANPERRAQSRRTLDYDYDAELICADFLRDYGIDLTDPACRMHWWRFCALLDGLSTGDGSRIMAERGYRSIDEHERPPKGERDRLHRLRMDHRLPPLTEREVEAAEEAERAQWGD